MKGLILNFLITGSMILSNAAAYAQQAPLFIIAESGTPVSVDLVLCLNAKGPISCQKYHVSAQNLEITTTIKRNYPFAGINILTPGYRATGCTDYSREYCLFTANGETPAPISMQKTTLSSHTTGGTVSGLNGTVILQNNGTDNLSVSTDGPFTFSTPIMQGEPYAVTVLTQPSGQTCTVSQGSGTMGDTDVSNVAVNCAINFTTLSSSLSILALSVTGRTEYGVSGNPASGVSRTITLSNTGSLDATGFQVNYSGLPVGTTHGGTCDGLGTLAQGASCSVEINPGATATSDANALSCLNGSVPVAGAVEFSADNAALVSTGIVVLDYGCVYQGGYVFALDDSTSTAGSIGGKVMTLTDQTSAPHVFWSVSPFCTADYFNIPGIDQNSTTPCVGKQDGACNSTQIWAHYTTAPKTCYAAGVCNLTIAAYADWYLPAICEMGYGTGMGGAGCGSALVPTTQNIQSSLLDSSASHPDAILPVGPYWSSTETAFTPQFGAWYENFVSGGSTDQNSSGKNIRYPVRCARALTL